MKHHSGEYYIKAAAAHGCEIKNGKGDHVKVYGEIAGNRTAMVIPRHRELATGTECVIRKWFIRVGIVLPILALFYWLVI